VGVIDGGHGREKGEGVRRVSASRSSEDGAAETSHTTREQNAREAGAVATGGMLASLRHGEVYSDQQSARRWGRRFRRGG
jgi:hypothetical protein